MFKGAVATGLDTYKGVVSEYTKVKIVMSRSKYSKVKVVMSRIEL